MSVTAGVRPAAPFTSLRIPAYRDWFWAQVLSASGLQTQNVAAAWVVLTLTHSGVALALLGVTSLGPTLLGSAQAGVLIDRLDRRRLLIITQTVFLIVSAALGLLSLTGTLTLLPLYALNLVAGVANALDGPTRQVYVLDLVGAGRLASAVSLYEVTLALSRMIGPAIGALLLAVVDPGACFLFNAATFLLPLYVLLKHRPAHAPTPAERPGRGRGAVAAGFRYTMRSGQIRSCLLLAIAAGMLFNTSVFYPLFATRALHLQAAGYALLVAAAGLGAVPGAILAAQTKSALTGRRVAVLAALAGLVTVATAFARSPAEAYLGSALIGLTSICFVASANTLVQLQTAPAIRGRVMGIWTMAMPGMNPVTGLLVGLAVDRAGPRWAIAAVGLVLLVCVASCWRAVDQE